MLARRRALPARPAAHRPRRTGRRPGRRVSTSTPSACRRRATGRVELGVVGRQDAVLRLDHRDLGAELGEGDAELEPDIAGADHGQALGDRRQRQRLGRGDDAAAERQRGQRSPAPSRSPARHARRRTICGPVSVSTRQVLPSTIVGVAVHDLDLVALQQRADAAGQAADDAVLPFDGAREVDGRPLDPQAERRRASPARRA